MEGTAVEIGGSVDWKSIVDCRLCDHPPTSARKIAWLSDAHGPRAPCYTLSTNITPHQSLVAIFIDRVRHVVMYCDASVLLGRFLRASIIQLISGSRKSRILECCVLCHDSSSTPGMIRLILDYYACYPDPCFTLRSCDLCSSNLRSLALPCP